MSTSYERLLPGDRSSGTDSDDYDGMVPPVQMASDEGITLRLDS